MYTHIVLAATAIVIGAMRILGHDDPTFQAIAHLTVGGFFGACVVLWCEPTESSTVVLVERNLKAAVYLTLGIGLTLVEAGAFAVSRLLG